MKENSHVSPAIIFRQLNELADKSINSKRIRQNLNIKIDFHWFFLHSEYYKKKYTCNKHIGKWKYQATSYEDLIEKISIILPIVAHNKISIAKLTNVGNVFSGEKLLLVYCFPFGGNT